MSIICAILTLQLLRMAGMIRLNQESAGNQGSQRLIIKVGKHHRQIKDESFMVVHFAVTDLGPDNNSPHHWEHKSYHEETNEKVGGKFKASYYLAVVKRNILYIAAVADKAGPDNNVLMATRKWLICNSGNKLWRLQSKTAYRWASIFNCKSTDL